MSLNLKKAAKSGSRIHKERGQPAERKHLGFLEKKKDYKLRANDHQEKQKVLHALKQKALNRNPDEFYFHMVNSATREGVHYEKDKVEEHTPDQVKLMHSQDLRYVSMKRVAESRKIERLKSVLHFLDAEVKPRSKHTFFVDSKTEASKFDVVTHLDTHPDLMDRAYNRPHIDDLKVMKLQGPVDKDIMDKLLGRRQKAYRELEKRIEREKQLRIVEQKLEAQRNLVDGKGGEKPREVKPATKDSAPVYRWKQERKK